MQLIRRAFVWLSGADPAVLERCGTERPKYLGLGGAVLFTAGLTATACVFTLSSFLGVPMPLAVVAGALWGLGILNFDRWAVSATRRQKSPIRNVAIFVPRVALALIVGLVVAEPLVLRVFGQEITAQAVRAKQAALAQQRTALDQQFTALTAAQQQQATLQKELAAGPSDAAVANDPTYQAAVSALNGLQAQLPGKEQAVVCEERGGCGATGPGEGPVAHQLLNDLASLQQQIARQDQTVKEIAQQIMLQQAQQAAASRPGLEGQLARVSAQVASLSAAKAQEQAAFDKAMGGRIGLLDRMEALSALAKGNAAVRSAEWVLRLFVLCLDLLPILIKTLMSIGPPSLYELTLHDEEEALRRSNQRTIQDQEQQEEAARKSGEHQRDTQRSLEELEWDLAVAAAEAEMRRKVRDNAEQAAATRNLEEIEWQTAFDASAGPVLRAFRDKQEADRREREETESVWRLDALARQQKSEAAERSVRETIRREEKDAEAARALQDLKRRLESEAAERRLQDDVAAQDQAARVLIDALQQAVAVAKPAMVRRALDQYVLELQKWLEVELAKGQGPSTPEQKKAA